MHKPFKTALEGLTEPLPYDQWPAWAKTVAEFKQQQDIGVGDTIHRMLGSLGERFKAWTAKLHVPCRCDQRQQEYNARFKYESTQTSQAAH